MPTVSTGFLDEELSDNTVMELLSLRPWMKQKKFTLIRSIQQLEDYIDDCINEGTAAVDLETTGLNSRIDSETGETVDKIVGICLAHNEDEGIYVPIRHADERYNLPPKPTMEQIKRLVHNCVTIYHNFKFDGEFLRGEGIIIEDDKMYEDTMLMAYVENAARLSKGLKDLSKELLNQEMIEIKELVPDKARVDFAAVPPKTAVYYAGSDAICTYGLYNHYKKRLEEIKSNGLNLIYSVEKRCQIVVMEMERNMVMIDRKYFQDLESQIESKLEEMVADIYAEAGRSFDIMSPKQLGTLLFDEMKIPYPKDAERGANGQYKTDGVILEKIGEYKIASLILEYRGLRKTKDTYVVNFLKNADKNDCVKFKLNPTQADTGRFSATGGNGLEVDGYSGVNCQNIPANYDPDAIDIRKGIIARPGYQLVAIDYSGEELRIAANMSQEKRWIDEFVYGEGDLHSITARIIYGRNDVSKQERGVGKSLNFLTIYGGGAGRFSQVAKIPMAEAQNKLADFFDELPGLSGWLRKEMREAKNRGYSLTSFGRRRPLQDLFGSGDKKLEAKASRMAVNSAVQGCLQYHQPVLTDRGYLPIGLLEDLKDDLDGVKVWTGNEWAGFKVVNKGPSELARIELFNGLAIDCDTRHEVLVVGKEGYEFKHYSLLTEKDMVCVSIPEEKEYGAEPCERKFLGGSSHNSPDMAVSDWNEAAYFLGAYLGDGNLRLGSRESVTFSFGKEKLDRVLPRIKAFCKESGLNVNRSVRKSSHSKGEAYQWEVSGSSLAKFMVYMGCDQHTSHTKRVPAKILSSTLSMRKEFLRGYFDTDGAQSAKNRYGFHTPNRDLLADIQQLAWTVGLDSCVFSTSAGTHRLDWSDLPTFEKTLSLPEVKRARRFGSSKMLIPEFLREDILQKIDGADASCLDRKDKALLSKLSSGKRVTVQTCLYLLDKLGIDRPRMYFHYPIKSKVSFGTIEDTYTLSVDHPTHRFDSSCIISKNTGADIIKIAMYKVWKYIRENGLMDDVRLIMPIHDEIVYEMRKDKLDELIPAISEVMKLDDLLKGHLKWKVGLEVDAEYGDTFHVDHDYFKELAKRKESGEEPKAKEEASEIGEESTVKEDSSGEKVSNEGESGIQELGMDDLNVPETEVKPKESSSESTAESELGQEKESPYYDYPVKKNDWVAKKQADLIWVVLAAADQYCRGPKKRIRLINEDGEVLHVSAAKLSVDGFIAMAINYDI